MGNLVAGLWGGPRVGDSGPIWRASVFLLCSRIAGVHPQASVFFFQTSWRS